MSLAAQFFARFGRRAVLLDSNLLLLIVAGSFDRRLIKTFKRLNAFTVRDFEILALLVSEFEVLASTPHVLTEVNSFINQLESWIKPDFYAHFASSIQKLDERYVSSTVLSSLPEFRIFGLTDAALSLVAKKALFVTNDGRLSSYLQERRVFAANLDEIRAIYPREA
jgi:hypothetical protein